MIRRILIAAVLAGAALAAPAAASAPTLRLSSTLKVDHPARIQEQAATNPAGPLTINATISCDGFTRHTRFAQQSYAIVTLRTPAGAAHCVVHVTATAHRFGALALKLHATPSSSFPPPHLTL